MAGPQFSVPPRVTPSRPKRRFTLAEANRTLPLVCRIVSDITREHQKVTGLQEQLQHLSASAKARPQVEKDLEAGSERVSSLVEELTQIGCQIKDLQTGLVDFIGRHQGRDVCLCWKLGEAQVAHWHELDAGAAGRQPVSTLREGD
jgi:hypothetical protein